jgi:hypothetical protein
MQPFVLKINFLEMANSSFLFSNRNVEAKFSRFLFCFFDPIGKSVVQGTLKQRTTTWGNIPSITTYTYGKIRKQFVKRYEINFEILKDYKSKAYDLN